MTSSGFNHAILASRLAQKAGVQSARPSDPRPASAGLLSWKGATRMAHKQLRFLGVVAAAMILTMACGGSSGSPPAKTFKIGLVTDIGGLNDKRFNQLADVGLEKVKTDFDV